MPTPTARPSESHETQSKRFHVRLNTYNAARLLPRSESDEWVADLALEAQMRLIEGHFVERERGDVTLSASLAPRDPAGFMRWFEELRNTGPGQHDPLFCWLGRSATLEQMRWFLTQEAAGEAGFEDLVALTQIRFPARAKLEMARNYWDEMGRGHERGMHGPMLNATVRALALQVSVDQTAWEALALSNLMVALAANRRYAYQAIGALGVIEMTAPTRVCHVNDGLKRLGVDSSARLYFQLHAGLDIAHSKAWNKEVIAPLVYENPELARPIAEGALLRLTSGARCFERYRAHFGLDARCVRPVPSRTRHVKVKPMRVRASADANERPLRPIFSVGAPR